MGNDRERGADGAACPDDLDGDGTGFGLDGAGFESDGREDAGPVGEEPPEAPPEAPPDDAPLDEAPPDGALPEDALPDAVLPAEEPAPGTDADTDGEKIAGRVDEGELVQAATAATPTVKAAAPTAALPVPAAAPTRIVRTFIKPPTE